jgi:uncharacterized RDD family membrane protein YckC
MQRWWDGTRWTDHVAGLPPQPVASQAAVGPPVATGAGNFILSGWWRRFGAYVLDSIIVGVPSFIVGLAIGVVDFTTSPVGTGHRTLSAGAQAAVVVTAVVVALGYPYLLLRYRGQTVGMMAFKVRAIDRASGGALTSVQTWRRVLAYFFLVVLWAQISEIIYLNSPGSSPPGGVLLRLLSFAGLITTALWPLANPANQTLQDKAADTVVIRTF